MCVLVQSPNKLSPLNLKYAKVLYSRRLLGIGVTGPVHSLVQSRVQTPAFTDLLSTPSGTLEITFSTIE